MFIERILVVGAGAMGHGIAQVAGMAGYRVALFDVDAAVVEKGLGSVKASLEKMVAKGKVLPATRDQALTRISTAPKELAEAAKVVDLVIEAVPEKLELKQRIFEELGKAAPAKAILATNTSSLPVAKIAEASGRPERVLGMHFFNPVPIMELLEIVRTDRTDADVLATVQAAGKQMGKTVVTVKDSPGFATSRLGIALGLEAIRMVEEGVASAQDIDVAMKLGYGHPMGPLQLTDFVGLDVRLGIAEHLAKTLDDRRFAPPELLRRMVKEGKLGKKSGQGFYPWPAS
jgi:3-hydroxybutyryl-CoA dehydrogenase